jgi:hypothetical protein
MPHESSRSLETSTLNAPALSSDGTAVNNTILLGLPRGECQAVLSKSELVPLPTYTLLNKMAERIKFAYSPEGWTDYLQARRSKDRGPRAVGAGFL